tara:strand:+ start:4985 stop:5422 length:438 start_codon:yes stop_codon:yes gene_type:complete
MNNTLQEVLRSEISLTKEIGITVSEYTGDSLTLQAPLENNLNHKCTAFGGSIYSVSVLSGWGLLYLLLKEHGLAGHIVIQESNTQFLKPVEADLSATCSFESMEQKDKFIRMFKRKGVARIQLESRITFDNDDHVIFNGAYVVHT